MLYFASYIVLDKGDTNLEYKQVLSEKEYQDARETWGNRFRVGMGAESIKELLQAIDLETEAVELKMNWWMQADRSVRESSSVWKL